MTEGNLHSAIRDYPLFIEPTVERLEGRAAVQQAQRLESEDGLRWTVLYRIASRRVSLSAHIPDGVCHFFGDNDVFSLCSILLGYDCAGRLLYLFTVDKRKEWTAQALPEEMTGKAICYPSVRLVFHDREARDKFLDDVQAGKGGPAGFAAAPRLVAVWENTDD